MTETRIQVTDDGPYKVSGSVVIEDGTGEVLKSSSRSVYLCRCGGSSKKPFCDGTHSRVGFCDRQRADRG